MSRIKNWLKRFVHLISPIAVLIGFLFDYFTLTRIDRLYDNAVIITYLSIAGIGIVIVNMYESARIRGRVFNVFYTIFPLVIQFCFGGLFSAFTVFYSRSATLAGSWPYMLLLGGFLIVNEFLKRHYRRLTLQVSVFFFVLLSYAILIIPTLLKAMGPWIFILSGLLSLILIDRYLWIIKKAVPSTFHTSQMSIKMSVVIIFLSVNVLYFFNIIPPVPLSMKSAGIYHDLTITSGREFIVKREEHPWYSFIFPYERFHISSGDPVYAVSAIYAPSNLKANIVHEWTWYNESSEQWESKLSVPFSITGGRLTGYRGYSVKRNLEDGKWRVYVKTERGELVGRIDFKIIKDSGKQKNLIEEVLQ